MIKGIVTRQRSTPLGTPGSLAMPLFACDTLELAWHNNERGRSCTAPGTERGRVWWSPSMKRLVIRFENRNGRSDVLIHNGNFAADAVDVDGDGVKEVAQIHGCTEVGSGYGDIQRRDGKMQWGIKFSGATLAALIESLRWAGEGQPDTVIDGVGYHDVEIEYRWAEGCEPQ